MKITIGMASLSDIAETACKAYRKELAEAEFLSDIQCTFDSLADRAKTAKRRSLLLIWSLVNILSGLRKRNTTAKVFVGRAR